VSSSGIIACLPSLFFVSSREGCGSPRPRSACGPRGSTRPSRHSRNHQSTSQPCDAALTSGPFRGGSWGRRHTGVPAGDGSEALSDEDTQGRPHGGVAGWVRDGCPPLGGARRLARVNRFNDLPFPCAYPVAKPLAHPRPPSAGNTGKGCQALMLVFQHFNFGGSPCLLFPLGSAPTV
jgi:hypothetical protein